MYVCVDAQCTYVRTCARTALAVVITALCHLLLSSEEEEPEGIYEMQDEGG